MREPGLCFPKVSISWSLVAIVLRSTYRLTMLMGNAALLV